MVPVAEEQNDRDAGKAVQASTASVAASTRWSLGRDNQPPRARRVGRELRVWRLAVRKTVARSPTAMSPTSCSATSGSTPRCCVARSWPRRGGLAWRAGTPVASTWCWRVRAGWRSRAVPSRSTSGLATWRSCRRGARTGSRTPRPRPRPRSPRSWRVMASSTASCASGAPSVIRRRTRLLGTEHHGGGSGTREHPLPGSG